MQRGEEMTEDREECHATNMPRIFFVCNDQQIETYSPRQKTAPRTAVVATNTAIDRRLLRKHGIGVDAAHGARKVLRLTGLAAEEHTTACTVG